jgi:adenosylcobyric acid synthase
VAPFKGQNMSPGSRRVDGGAELGVAQWLQALAARAVPDVRMNPVLVKPDHGSSRVVLLGREDAELSERGWTQRPPALWPVISRSLDELLDEYDLVVCEGAGSPAEVNLRDTDLANMRVAHAADARVLLVADIDRGGALAHLYGTWALLPEADRARLAGFVLNRFRGDAALLRAAPAQLAERTGMAYAGLLPMLAHRLPEEDGPIDVRPRAEDDDDLDGVFDALAAAVDAHLDTALLQRLTGGLL